MLYVAAQTKPTGYLYTQQTGSKAVFQYSITTRFANGAFQTIYKLYKQGASKNRYTITASHFKVDKKIVVEVNDEQYLLSVMNGREEVEYETETLQPFGIRGDMGILDKSAPSQLAIQFVSSRFEYVRVIDFLGSTSDGIFQTFVFNTNDKIIEPKNGVVNSRDSKKPKAKFAGSTKTDSASRLFTGTKNFCDSEKAWRWDVTIKNDSITLKMFAGSANDYHKNKSKPVEVIKGIVLNGKIITKDPPQYLTNRFKFENGILYEMNNEGDYNDFPECK
jgi:hypothetical protein